MKPFLSLLKLSFKNYYGISVLRHKYMKDRGTLWQPILALIGLGIGAFVLIGIYWVISYGLYLAGKLMSEPSLGLEIAILGASLFIFIFGISSVIGVLYFTSDSSFLASLPLKPWQVLAAKFTLVMTNEYLMLAFMLLPPLVVFATGEGTGVAFLVSALIIFLLLPIIPLAPAAAVSMAIMSRAGSKRLKDLFTIFSYLLLVAFGIGLQFFAQSLPKGNEINSLKTLLQANGSLIKTVGQSFPPAIWATKALSAAGSLSGLLYMSLFLLLTALLLVLMLFLGEHFFYRGLLVGEEVGTRKRHKPADGSVIWRPHTPVAALLLREHHLFMRTPVVVMNVLPVAIIIPVAALVPFYAQNAGLNLSFLAPYLTSHPYIKLGISAFVIFIAGTLPLAASACSREGRLFFFSQMIPVRAVTQIRVKFSYILAVNFICTLPFFVMAALITHLRALEVLQLTALNLAAVALVTAAGIIIDMQRPFFNWENPQRVVKNNLNLLLAMAVTLTFLLAAAAVSFVMVFVLPWWLGYTVLLVLTSGLTVGVYKYMLSLAEKRYREFVV
jgi:ABC-2 type transport system permease protein